MLGAVFAGDRRVWRWAAIAGLPLAAFVVVWCLVPRAYYTGTDSVNLYTVSTPIAAGRSGCAQGLNVPAGTHAIQLSVASGQLRRPRLTLTVTAGGRRETSSAAAAGVTPGVPARVSFPVTGLPSSGASVPVSVCVRGDRGSFALGGTPLIEPLLAPLRIGGHDTVLRLSAWYLPKAGAKRSYASELNTIFHRATVFSAGFLRPWMLWAVFLIVLPAIALLAVRCLAVASAGRVRRLALWLYVIAVINAAAWSVITPAFQAPDEVDHFAYVQSLAEQGHKPSPYAASTAARWSSAETDALIGSRVLTDHFYDDSRAPGLPADRAAYRALLARTHPRAGDGGGLQTTSGYGSLYYLAVTPGYLLASSGSVFSQLEAARLLSALIGALVCVFAFLTVRELAPRRPFLAVLAGLLVAFQPMYSFLSGAVNNDIGIDAGAAAVAWLLVRLLRRGPERRSLIALGVLVGVLPYVKDSAFELYPLVALGIAGAVWRARGWQPAVRRATAVAIGAFAGCAVVFYVAATALDRALTPAAPAGNAGTSVATAGSSISLALHHPIPYLVYLWEVFLPRLPGMARHFVTPGLPANTIITHRAWAAFGWYDTAFPTWVYVVLNVVMLGAVAFGIVALWRERRFARARWMVTAMLFAFPIVVVASFEAIFFTLQPRGVVAEMGRYVFPALVPLAAAAIGVLHAFGRRRIVTAGSVLAVAMVVFCYASQLLTLTAFFA